MLNDGGLAARQVAEGAVAHPRGLKGDVRGLRTAELATRSADVGAVVFRGRGHLPGLSKPPAGRLHLPPVVLVVLREAHRELESSRCPRRELLVFREGNVLLLVDCPSPELEFTSPPVGDCRIGRGRLHRGWRPLGQENGRRRIVPAEAAVGEAGGRGPDGLADGEVNVVRCEPDVAPGHPDLQQPWVSVDQRRASEPPHHRGRKHVPEIDE